MSFLANHLWQSTLFAAAAWLLNVALRRNSARVRHWIWLGASVKFLIPFSLLITAGTQIPPAHTALPPRQFSNAIGRAIEPFTIPLPAYRIPVPKRASPVLPLIWLCGSVSVFAFWFTRWRRVREMVRGASPFNLGAPIKTLSSPALPEPGIHGIFRPVLLLPEGVRDRLSPAQLRAIIAHELCHVRRRDNLAASLHMLVEALFWFHPLVWWIGARLVDERERACDEAVLTEGGEPQAYAEGILSVCRLYLESPLPCISGVTGADLKKRVEAIMTNGIALKLTAGRKSLLAITTLVAVAVPFLIGILRAQEPRLQFEVASIKRNETGVQGIDYYFAPGGRFHARNNPITNLITHAYGVAYYQLAGGPDWLRTDNYDVEAKAQGEPTKAEGNRMIRSLLEDRFMIKVHRETRDLPGYVLTVAKGGPKLPQFNEGTCADWGPGTPPPPPPPGHQRTVHCGNNIVTKGRWLATKIDSRGLAGALQAIVGRPVLDHTGLSGFYDVNLTYVDDALAGDVTGPSIFTAVRDELGLKLDSTKVPVEMLVIDHIERPSEN